MSGLPAFQQTQLAFAGHLRNPEAVAAPEGLEERRMAIYRELVYKNVESFLANGFPVFKSIVAGHHWHGLVRGFLRDHRSQSPYFLDIGQEFLRYLQEVRQPEGWEPPFMLELCHYEWVELALDTAEAELPTGLVAEPPSLDLVYAVSPLVWRLVYQYPVHRLSPEYQPQQPVPGGVHLLVYRNHRDEVGFLETNAAVSRMIQLIENSELSLAEVLRDLAAELHFADLDGFLSFAVPTITQLLERNILFPAAAAKR